jgi:type II secretory pathway component GspD/PulD (secretin)
MKSNLVLPITSPDLFMMQVKHLGLAASPLIAASCVNPSTSQSTGTPQSQASTVEQNYSLYSLKHVDATEVAETMNASLRDAKSISIENQESAEAVFMADPDTQSVIYVAPEGRESEILALLERLDRPMSQGKR